MPNPDTAAAIPGRSGPPWTAEGTVYFYGGWASNFAPTPGLRLPFGYVGHRKATSRREFDVILACGTAAAAKRAEHETELRPDSEQVKFEVMLYGGGFCSSPTAPRSS